MNYIFQLALILGVSFVGELLNAVLPFPIPASVYGLILLFLLLCSKIVKLEQVEQVAGFMISVMPIFFIEPTVGIMNSYGLVKGKIAALFIAAFLSFAAVLAVTGLTAQAIMKFKNKEKGREHESE
ncbi:MAG: CidA/LrgA family protein [Lachnospiraceae bacterium]|nr:CidA/LrgA family protein [Lachnospiraceae bacterium]